MFKTISFAAVALFTSTQALDVYSESVPDYAPVYSTLNPVSELPVTDHHAVDVNGKRLSRRQRRQFRVQRKNNRRARRQAWRRAKRASRKQAGLNQWWLSSWNEIEIEKIQTDLWTSIFSIENLK